MTITLTVSEEIMFKDLVVGAETIEDAFHRIMADMLRADSEQRLQRMADAYRAMSPEMQMEGLEVMRVWRDSKLEPKV